MNPCFQQMPDRSKLKVVFLVGSDSPSTRLSVERVCLLADVLPLAILLDSEKQGFGRRLKNLRKNVRKYGWKYVPARIIEGLRSVTDVLVENAAVSHGEVRRLLAKAFPSRNFTLSDIGRRYGFAVTPVGNLNEPHAVQVLTELNADLGIVIGTRVLQ